MRILILDDDPLMLKLLARQFQRLGHVDVCGVDRAEQALAACDDADRPVDLAVLDLQMPGTDGVEFLRSLVALDYRGAVLLISGEDQRVLLSAERLARVHRLRVLGALAKPVATDDLAALLRTLDADRAGHADGFHCSAEELRFAIWGGELVNHYQPLIEPQSGAVCAVEAIVHWRHPRAGLLAAEQFVGLAGRYGLSAGLTQQVLDDALRELRRWRDAGLALQLAVNIAIDNLAALDFPDFVTDALRRHGLGAADLTLEIGDRQLLADPRVALEVMTRLHLKRLRLAVDGFGAGHASLVRLRELPLDEVKIDGGLLDGAAHDPAWRSLFEASVGLAHDLGLATAAEGVTDADGLECARAAGCRTAQGPWIGPALSAAEIPAQVRQRAVAVGASG